MLLEEEAVPGELINSLCASSYIVARQVISSQ